MSLGRVDLGEAARNGKKQLIKSLCANVYIAKSCRGQATTILVTINKLQACFASPEVMLDVAPETKSAPLAFGRRQLVAVGYGRMFVRRTKVSWRGGLWCGESWGCNHKEEHGDTCRETWREEVKRCLWKS